MKLTRHAVTVLLFTLLWGAAHGAVTDDAPDLSELLRYERWGALRARPRLQLLDMGWDSNVFISQEETGDYRATVAPGLEGLILFGDRAFLRFDSEARYTAYSEYSELNYLDLRNAARVTFPIGRWAVYSGGGFDRVRKTPVDLDDVRPVYVNARAELGTKFTVSERSSLELGLAYRDLKHEDDDFNVEDGDLGARLDRVELENRTIYRHAVGGQAELSFEVAGAKIEFDTPNVVGLPGFGRDSRAMRLLPGISLGEEGPWTGRVELGYAELNYDSGTLPGYSGSVGRAELRYRPFQGSTWTLKGLREVDFSASQDNNYHVLQSARLNTLYFVSPVVGLELELARGELELPASSRVDDLLEYWGGLRFLTMQDAFGRRVEYRVKIGRRERDSSDPQRDRSGSAVTIDAVFGY